MRRVSGVVLYVIAGFFIYGVNLFGFVNAPTPAAKWGVMGVFIAIACLAQVGGLVLARFQNWRRDTGIVLLCASGFTALVALTLVCLFLSDEFRRLLQPDTLTFFSDYIIGTMIVVAFAGLGWLLLRARANTSESAATASASTPMRR